MTLEEKFKDVIEDAITHDQQYDSFEQIAEEFAIGFAEWLIKRETKYFESLKELLEIYKKTL
jgi:hypothetical protein